MSRSSSPLDQAFMTTAAATAVQGTTAENPAVGCVVVKDGEILARAATAAGGVPHAEAAVLGRLRAGESRGATVYSTLEPCAHYGKTPPCVGLLIKARVRRVVFATLDPNPLVNGKGAEALAKVGIEVTTLPNAAAAQLNCGFFRRMLADRPWVTLKMALDKRGAVAIKGKRKQISGREAANFAHLLRLRADVVAVGATTAEVDKPLLTCRLPGVKKFTPQPVIFSKKRAFNRGRAGNTLSNALVVGETRLEDSLNLLAERGYNRLLVEGGPCLASRFLEAELVDEIYLIRSAAELRPGPGEELVLAPKPLREARGFNRIHRLGRDVVEHCYVRGNHPSSGDNP